MKEKINYKLKISLTNKEHDSFMGIGLVWLLEKIDMLKSIRKAAIDMNMSYVKAVNIINRLEENLNQKVLTRTIGGNTKGGSELTIFGKQFMAAYKEFIEDVDQYAQGKFTQFIKKI